MTKAEFVDRILNNHDHLDKDEASKVVDVFFDSITEALSQGEKVELRGFGSFRVKTRNGRRGRNPKTGLAVQVPPKRIPYFRPGKTLKNLIDGE